MIALSGIDDTVKILAPTSSADKRAAVLHRAEEIMQRNREAEENGESYDGRSGTGIDARMLMALFEQRMREGEGEGAARMFRGVLDDEGNEGDCRLM